MVQIKNPLVVMGDSGSTPEPLDPEEVYADTRPSDWMEMPTTVNDNEIYFLLQIPDEMTDAVRFTLPGIPIVSGGTLTYEFGTVSSGVFTADATLTVTGSGSTTSFAIPNASFVDVTDDNQRQLMMKISCDTNITQFLIASSSYQTSSAFQQLFVEVKGVLEHITSVYNMFGHASPDYGSKRVRYISLYAPAVSNYGFFAMYCLNLICVLDLDTSSGTNFSYMFQGCYSLTAADFTGYDFSAVTSATALNQMLGGVWACTITFGDTFGNNGIINTATIVSSNRANTYSRTHIKITKDDAMLAIAANATTLFQGTYTYVYVPDALLSTYQADTYWATLGSRLKAMSDYPYTS